MTTSQNAQHDPLDVFRPKPGAGCPMCAEITAEPSEVRTGRFIADLSASRLLLAGNQYVKGMCVLISKTCADELHHLQPAAAGGYFNDLLLSSAAVEQVFAPHKLNWEVLGNWVPHIHGFIKPRYLDDPIPDNRIPHDTPWETVDEQEMDRLADLVRTALCAASEQAPRRLRLDHITDPIGNQPLHG